MWEGASWPGRVNYSEFPDGPGDFDDFDDFDDQTAMTITEPKLTFPVQNEWTDGQIVQISYVDPWCAPFDGQIREAVGEWQHYVGLRLQFVPMYRPAEIRITCRGTGYWSRVGPQGELPDNVGRATMCLAGLTTEHDARVRRGKILHEFGHALGAVHEHQNPLAEIKWDVPKVIDYYRTQYHWSEEVVWAQVLNQYGAETVSTSGFDRDSVMMYPIPKELTIDGLEVTPRFELSCHDKLTIWGRYPPLTGASPPDCASP